MINRIHRSRAVRDLQSIAGTGSRARSGVVLFAVLAALSALALLAGTLATVNVNDIRMLKNYKLALEAIYAADSGSHYVISRIEQDLRTGNLSFTNTVETINYTAPGGMDFDPVTRLVQTPVSNAYYFTVTGRALTANATIEVVVRRLSAMTLGLFGDEAVDLKAYGGVYSYNSGFVSPPTADDSTGNVMAGSNESFLTHQDTVIDGSFTLGEDISGVEGTWSEMPSGGSDIAGEAAIMTDRIDPDPLGVVSGDLAAEFVQYAIANDNGLAVPPITLPQNRILLGNGGTMTLSSGNYYISDITLRNRSSLTIDSSGGPVTIYLTGSMEAKEGSQLNVTGKPRDFVIYSNSSDDIILKHDGSFTGVVYAPLADIQVRNSADFYGVAWGGSLEIKNSGEFFIDLAVSDGFLSDRVGILSWKELRE